MDGVTMLTKIELWRLLSRDSDRLIWNGKGVPGDELSMEVTMVIFQDQYHTQLMAGNLTSLMREYLPAIEMVENRVETRMYQRDSNTLFSETMMVIYAVILDSVLWMLDQT